MLIPGGLFGVSGAPVQVGSADDTDLLRRIRSTSPVGTLDYTGYPDRR